MGTQEKLEKKVIDFFKENLQTLHSSTDPLIALGHSDKAIGFFKNFLLLIEEIRQDPRFTYMDKFQQFVTDTQNTISLKISELELTWSKIYPKGSQSLNIKTKHGMRSKNQFYSQIDQIQKEFLDSVSETPENEFEHYLNNPNF